jgi:Gluconate 2-dehydrogenase subunit 3
MNPQTQSDDVTLINRREAIRRVSALLGGIALVGSDRLLRAPRTTYTNASDVALSPQEVAWLDELAETILPRTSTPGAKDAGVGPFIAVMFTDTYDEGEQQRFRDGMKAIDDASMKAYGRVFMDLTPEQRLAVLQPIDQEQKTYSDALGAYRRNESLKWLNDQRQQAGTAGPDKASPAPAITADSPPHYFRMMKELVLLGYFTSEPGMTKAQRYIEAPGRYDPCLPYKAGERSWAGHA